MKYKNFSIKKLFNSISPYFSNKILFLFLLLPIFRFYLYKLVDTIFIKNIISSINRDSCTDIFLLIMGLTILYRILKFRDHELITFLTLVYIYFAVFFYFNYEWTYLYFSFSDSIKYIYFINILALISLIFHGCNLSLVEVEGVQIKQSKSFVEDIEINDSENDSMNRDRIAVLIKDLILNTRNNKAFAIGISGRYGSGKSSFINLIKNSIKNSKNENTIIIDFNPWSVGTRIDLQKAFFEKLISNLSLESHKLSDYLNNYYSTISQNSNNISNFLISLKDILHIFKFNVDDKERINELTSNLEKKIIIVIDDVDRLYKEEIIDILKIIRSTGNFSNIFYLVAYDKTYLEKSLKDIVQANDNNYLDKIFQLEVPLPSSLLNNISHNLMVELSKILSEEDIDTLNNTIIPKYFSDNINNQIGSIFNSKRDVIRFVNSFNINYTLIDKNVSFEKFFILQILKFYFPIFYDKFYLNKKEYLKLNNKGNIKSGFYSLDVVNSKKYKYEDLVEELNISVNRTIISNILKTLFKVSATQHSIDICNPSVFESYFVDRIDDIKISKEELLYYILNHGDQSETFMYINSLVSQGFVKNLLNHLLTIDLTTFKNNIQYELFMKITMSNLGQKMINEENIYSFDFEKFIEKFIPNDHNSIIDLYPLPELYASFLREKFKEISFSSVFNSFIIINIISKYNNKFPLSLFELVSYQIDNIDFILNQDSEINSINLNIIMNIKDIESLESDKNIESNYSIDSNVLDKFNFVIKNNPLDSFFKAIILENGLNKFDINKKAISKLFYDRENLIKIINSNNQTQSNVKDEFIDFLNKSYDKGNFINYDFKFIKF